MHTPACGRIRPRGEEATRRSAKPLCEGSIPSRASIFQDSDRLACLPVDDVNQLTAFVLSLMADVLITMEMARACFEAIDHERDAEDTGEVKLT